MERMDFALDLKALSDEGVLEGYASTYGNVDRMGDQVEPGAFVKTLQEHNGRVPLLVNHDLTRRAGIALVDDRPKGLKLTGLLNLDVMAGKELYGELKFYAVHDLTMGLSIGFLTKRDQWVNGTRHLLEVDLWEVSCVTFPANPQATVTAVKGDQRQAWAGLLRDMQTFNQAHQPPHQAPGVGWRALLKDMQVFLRQRQAVGR